MRTGAGNDESEIGLWPARVVAPEQLDSLPAHAREAARSRRDLRRLNRLMGHVSILSRELRPLLGCMRELRVAEVGAGDGTLMLRIAERFGRHSSPVDLTLVDRQRLVDGETRSRFAELNWHTRAVDDDLFEWISRSDAQFDVIVANLVLHHFSENRLRALFRECATRTQMFLALEPRRSSIGALLSRTLWVIGCGRVTCHDAPVSVRAGFTRRELSALWPEAESWSLRESHAGVFSHLFVARRG